mgnify:CR=1 FL=1
MINPQTKEFGKPLIPEKNDVIQAKETQQKHIININNDDDSIDPKHISSTTTVDPNYIIDTHKHTSSSPIEFKTSYTSQEETDKLKHHNTENHNGNPSRAIMHSDKPMKRLGSLHGKTTEIAEAQITNKRWDWNSLPSLHGSLLEVNENGYNVAHVSVDGEMKSIKYDPNYNKILPQMDLFLRFNQESTIRESLLYAKKRLKSYAKFLEHYVRELEKSSNNKQIELIKEAKNETRPNHFQSLELIQLWSFQVETYFTQSNSLLFCPEVTQILINRRSQRRKSTTTSIEETLLTHKSESTRSWDAHTNTNTIMSDPLEDIDLLLLRPLITHQIGWQLAYNEPQITVADYELNIAPWKEADEVSNSRLIEFMEGNEVHYSYNEGAKITSDLADIKYINNLNAREYFLDCMDRKLNGGLKPNDMNSENLMDDTDVSSITRSEHSLNFHRSTSDAMSIKSYVSPSVIAQQQQQLHKKKRKEVKPKKSGFVNFFRRKHVSLSNATDDSQQQQSLTEGHPDPIATRSTIGAIPTLSANTPSTGTYPMKLEKQLHNQSSIPFESIDDSISEPTAPKNTEDSLQNEWLQNHYCEILNNYKKISMPTQYYFPRNKSSGLTPELSPNSQTKPAESSQESFNSEEQLPSLTMVNNRGYYGRELLQLKLPFNRDSIPAVLCPWIWTTLTRTKWGNLLREIKRCLQPEGYVLAIATDLRVSNSEYNGYPEASAEFKSSVERNRIFDLLSIEAMNKGLHIFPTKHLARKFKECGFVNIKTTTLSLKSGDLKTNMGCINEFMITLLWHLLTGSRAAKETAEECIQVDNITERYIKEHWDKIDNHAGCLRTVFIVAQKPKN